MALPDKQSRLTHNLKVAGSNPAPATNQYNHSPIQPSRNRGGFFASKNIAAFKLPRSQFHGPWTRVNLKAIL